MNSLSPLQQIDHVLKVLKNDRGHINFYDLHRKLKLPFGIGQEWLIDGDILLRILEKLVRDKYVYEKHSPDEVNYAITVEGVLFHGYEKQCILEDERLSSIGQMAIATKKYNTRLLWATWCAGIAAALLLLWQVWIWFYPVHANYPYWIWETIAKKKI